jgi:hypothetical protein
MHKMVAAFAAVFVVGVAAGSAEMALHGVPFFVFRANGAGASLTGPKEDQGPGQPGAPGARHQAPAATPGATAKAHGPGAKAKGRKSRAKKSQGKQRQGKRSRSKQSRGKQSRSKQSRSKQPHGQQSPKPGKSG